MSRHPELRPLLEDTELSGAERHALLEHVRVCRTCRLRVAAEEPTRLFALLATEPVAPEMLERLSRNVNTALDAGTGVAEPPLRRRYAVGAAAAALLLAGAFSTYLVLRGDVQRQVALARSLEAQGPVASGPTAVELHAPQRAEVVNFAVGDTQLVMIFDEALDL